MTAPILEPGLLTGVLKTLQHYYDLAKQHPELVAILGALWLLSNAVSYMPTPKSEERWYKYLYDFAHGVFGNAARFLPWFRHSRDKQSS